MIEVNFCEFTRAWDIPKIAVCTDTGCACYSHKSHSADRKQRIGKPAIITLNYPADAKLITKEEVDEK